MKHPIIHTTRESFLDASNWTKSKKGNLFIRDHNATYTLREEVTSPDVGVLIHTFRCVIVGPAGERRDIGPFASTEEMNDALWPEGDDAPIGVEP